MSDLIVREADNYLPVCTVAELLDRKRMLQEYTAAMMIDGEDFGTIPGTGTRKVLLKPGAEKLIRIFGLTPRFSDVTATEDWTGTDHAGETFFHYTIKCSLYRQERFMGDADGSCNSWEKKYRYVKQERTCPICAAAAIIKGKQEYGGGYVCFDKKGGCKAKFKDGDPRIEGQSVGQIPDPDIADKVNTIRKMAEKRALVAACLIVVGASEFFTQDIEPERSAPSAPPPQSRPAPPPRQEPAYEAEFVLQDTRPANVDEYGVVHDTTPKLPATPRQQAIGAFRKAARAIDERFGHPSFKAEDLAKMVKSITEDGREIAEIGKDLTAWDEAAAVLLCFKQTFPNLSAEDALKAIRYKYHTEIPMSEFTAAMWLSPFDDTAEAS